MTMKNLFLDFTSFIKSLTLIDILFILSLIGLVVLIVTLLYIIKVNNEDNIEIIDDNEVKKETQIQQLENKEENEELDLARISKEIDENPTKPITLNDYEREQEEKAIISYDELIKTKEIPLEEINYKNEENVDGLTVKTVNLDEITKPIELPKIKTTDSNLSEEKPSLNKLISYEKEDEFLAALKQLESLLN